MNRAVVLALLAACAGVVDVWAVVALGGAFAGVVTGNLVTAGHALAVAEPARLLPPAVAVAGFVVGVALWSLLRRRWPTAVSVPLVAELVVLVVLAVAWPLAPGATLPLLAGAALAMGGQSSVAQLLGQSTTYMTGTLTDAVSDLATGDGRRWPALRQLAAIVLGAVAGGLALAHLPAVVPALAALLAAAAVVVRAVGDRRVQDDPVGPSAPQDDDVEGAPTVPLHPQVEALLNLMAEQGGAPPETMTVAQNRAMIREMAAVSGPPEPVAAVRDDRAGDVPVRIYTPEGTGPFPVLVFYHGGGWVIGDLDSHDPVCRSLANRSGAVVVAVDYRLAPEHRFPAAVEDAVAALEWVHAHAAEFDGDPSRIAVGGDSAGGNLSAVVAQHARDHGPALRFQLLVYPAVDAADRSPSMTENAQGPLLTVAWMEWFMGHYLTGDQDALDPRMSPARTTDLSGLPPALVVTAEFDPLRDQGAAYAAALNAAGVKAELRESPGMIHGFLQFGAAVDDSRALLDEAGAALRAALA